MRTLALAAALALLALAVLMQPDVPSCPEDSVLVGTGAYDHGRWTAYECGPAVDDAR